MTNLLQYPYNLLKPLYRKTSFHRSVIEELESRELREAYAVCRNLTRRHAKTFYMAARFLPNRKQRGIFALYSLCRYVDDLVDEQEDLVEERKLDYREVRRKIDSWQRKLRDAYEGRAGDNPILLAFSDVLHTCRIPVELPFHLIEGICMDLWKTRYHSFGEVYEYSWKVASSVGLMCCEIFGYRSPRALRYAEDLGVAMQLTNILRDVGEDLERNRIYLSRLEMRRFGVEEEDLFSHRLDENFHRLMRFQIARARRYYRRSELGIPLLSADSRLPVYLARGNYARILDKIEGNGYDVFHCRAYLNTAEKLALIPGVLYRMRHLGR